MSKPAAFLAREEFGDVPGHPFHGNQWGADQGHYEAGKRDRIAGKPDALRQPGGRVGTASQAYRSGYNVGGAKVTPEHWRDKSAPNGSYPHDLEHASGGIVSGTYQSYKANGPTGAYLGEHKTRADAQAAVENNAGHPGSWKYADSVARGAFGDRSPGGRLVGDTSKADAAARLRILSEHNR